MDSVVYSLIIPHKNSPKDLKRLLDTIPEREDLQVIVVDDNSDSNQFDIDEFKNQIKSNVELVITTGGEGAGHARNVGLQKAKGKWLLFADADDMFTDFLPRLLDKYKKDETIDIVYLNAVRTNESGERWPFVSDFYIRNYNKNKCYSEKVLRYGMWSPWTRMVKNELVKSNSICFEEIPTGNDMMFSLNCSKFAKIIATEESVLYLYFVPQNRSKTEEFRRKVTNVKFRIELGLRQNELYKSVGYIFKDTNISSFRNPPAGCNLEEYKVEYKKQLKIHNISFFSEVKNYIICKIGIYLGLIME